MTDTTIPRQDNGRTADAPLRRKPTINDVAQLAGVSFGTVSRVLNDAPDVSASTRERVLKVIKDIGYRRNRAATALVTSRSTSIGILSDGSPVSARWEHSWHSKTLRGTRATPQP